MGNRHHPRGQQPALSLAPFEKGFDHCAQIEHEFLNLLGTDINQAGVQLPKMRRMLLQCKDGHGKDHHRALELWLDARFHEARSDHRVAIRLVRRALRLYQELAEESRLWLCYRLLFSAYAHLGNYRAARQQAELALGSANIPLAERLKFLVNLGGLEFRVHHYEQALANYMQALEILKFSPNRRTEAIARYNLGNVHLCLNRFGEAEENYNLAQERFQNEGLVLYRAHALQAYGNLYIILGQYFHAENRLLEARQVYLEAGDRFGAALCDLELLRMMVRLNRWEQALELSDTLAETCRKLGRKSELGLVHFHSAEAAIATGDDSLGLEFLNAAIRLFRRENNELYLARCQMMKALIRHRAKDTRAAIQLLGKARAVFLLKKVSELETEAITHLWLINGKKLEQPDMLRLKTLLHQPISPHTRTQALVTLSDCLSQRGKQYPAIRLLFEAINAVEESRASIISGKQRESFFANKAQLYERLIEKLFGWRSPKAVPLIFKVMELSRGRQMAEQLSQREALPPVLNINEPIILNLRKLELRLKQLNQRLEDFSVEAQTSESDKQVLVEQIRHLRHEKHKLTETMGHEARLALFFPIPLEIDRIRQSLADDELLVVFFITDRQIYRLELGKTILCSYKTELHHGFERDFNALSNILAHRLLPKMDQIQPLAEKISLGLVPQNLKGIRSITFVPHKQLQRFPFALVSRHGRRLIEDYCIQVCPNVPVFHFARQKPASQFLKPLFFFSDNPKDPTASERKFLRSQYPHAQEFDRLLGRGISRMLSQSDFIHFAGHCYFNQRNPDTSYLQLQDERVYLADFGKIQLDATPFINLAACQSGWMAMNSGNEPHGFVITAFAAGATSILSTLWEVDDNATGDWMETFYKSLTNGLSSAYRTACLETAQKYPEPYFWAGFSLIGRG